MGYIDSDTHVVENDHTWEYLDPGEDHFKPTRKEGYWWFQDLVVEWPPPRLVKWNTDVYPTGAGPLTDIRARLSYMDEHGVDVQILFPTFWLMHEISSILGEAALTRSYNRWLAATTADSEGRLRWAIHVPVRTMDRALEELEFGKDHGAASVFMLGQAHGMSLMDPYLFPLYEKAQDLDLAISIHVGAGDIRKTWGQPGNGLYHGVMRVPGALYAIIKGQLGRKFPRLRWVFVEAGATWLPFVLQESFRADEQGINRSFKDWRKAGQDTFAETELYVACQADDDLPYLVQFAGSNKLIHGTDFGHLDVGSDPSGLEIVAGRKDVDSDIASRIVDQNGRVAYGIDSTFRPAPLLVGSS